MLKLSATEWQAGFAASEEKLRLLRSGRGLRKLCLASDFMRIASDSRVSFYPIDYESQ